ncbi:MAG TPA: hypothetical protein VKB40_02300 [Candidatus Acidoferrales bacterium]|nr:hypothetical protein [Candidatus Acidoferrales bacterium]
MKKSVSGLAAVVLCSLGLASASSAQMMRGGGPPQFAGVFNPKVGAGAAYEVQKQDGNKTMEMAIVGKETVDGKDAYWWEMAMPDERAAGEFVFKTLLVMDGENPHSSKVIMQLPGKPPMEMPAGMGRGDHSRVPTDVRTGAEDLGSESITVPAGTFTTEHYRAKDGSGDTWVAKDAGPYGLVKHQGKDSTMVLTKVFSDYKDKITGTPQPFNPMMMGGGQQR